MQIAQQLDRVQLFFSKYEKYAACFLFQPSTRAAEDPRGAVVRVRYIGLSPDGRILRRLPGGSSLGPGHVLRSL